MTRNGCQENLYTWVSLNWEYSIYRRGKCRRVKEDLLLFVDSWLFTPRLIRNRSEFNRKRAGFRRKVERDSESCSHACKKKRITIQKLQHRFEPCLVLCHVWFEPDILSFRTSSSISSPLLFLYRLVRKVAWIVFRYFWNLNPYGFFFLFRKKKKCLLRTI